MLNNHHPTRSWVPPNLLLPSCEVFLLLYSSNKRSMSVLGGGGFLFAGLRSNAAGRL